MNSAPPSFGFSSINPVVSTSLGSLRSNLGYPLVGALGGAQDFDSTAGASSARSYQSYAATIADVMHPSLISATSAIEEERYRLINGLLARPDPRAFSAPLTIPGLFTAPLASVSDAPALSGPWAQGDSSIQDVLRKSQPSRDRSRRVRSTSLESKKPSSVRARSGISHHTFPLPCPTETKPFRLGSLSTFQALWEKFQTLSTSQEREAAFQKELFSRAIASTDGRSCCDSDADSDTLSRKRKR
jgi:hypothetical protein